MILQKLRWAKDLGGSEKQIADCMSVYEMRARDMDLELLRHWAMWLGVTDALEKIIREAEPL